MEAAEAATHAGDLAGAEKAYKGALAADAKCLAARSALAAIYMSRGEAERALREHRQGVEIDPRSPDTHIALARGLMECRRYAEAVTCLERGIRVAPRDLYLRVLLESCYRRAGQVEKAKQGLAELEKLDPGSPVVKSAMRAMGRDAQKKAPASGKEMAGAKGRRMAAPNVKKIAKPALAATGPVRSSPEESGR
jgi:tetratricopeptide (TPR) repeat protein